MGCADFVFGPFDVESGPLCKVESAADDKILFVSRGNTTCIVVHMVDNRWVAINDKFEIIGSFDSPFAALNALSYNIKENTKEGN